MISYLRTYRPLNLLLIGTAQILCAYFLFFEGDLTLLYQRGLHFLVAGTLTIAAFGYLLNDYFDVERDAIDKPGKFNLRVLDKRLLLVHLLLIVSVVLYCGNALGGKFLTCFIGCSMALWIYNYKLKDYPLLGNILIAGLSFLSVYIVRWMFPEIDVVLLVHFALLAALLNFCREIVKDAEDVRGDKHSGAKTVPIVLGYTFANRVVYFTVLFIMSFTFISVYYQSQYFAGVFRYLYWSYYLLFVIAPLYYVAMQIKGLRSKEDYRTISKLLKYVVYTGILSILFY